MSEYDKDPSGGGKCEFKPTDDLEIASRIMETVQRQVASYRMSLEKLRALRKEIEIDEALNRRIRSGPEAMVKVLTERGIPDALAYGMTGEDYRNKGFGGGLGFWTWDCCCTACCLTCVCTGATAIVQQ